MKLGSFQKPYHLFILLGFTSIVSQVLLMRELVVVFYGNELSLGIMLGSWLFWVGAGSYLAAVVLPRLRALSGVGAVASAQALLGLTAALTVLGARGLPHVLRVRMVGEIVGYVPVFLFSFLILAPMCLLMGVLFTLFCHLWSGRQVASSIGAVYFFEALGSACGGALFAYLLVRFLDPIEVAGLLMILNFAGAASTLALDRRLQRASAVVSLLTLSVAAVVFFGAAGALRASTLQWLWGGLRVVESDHSIYGNVTLIQHAEQRTLYENGLLMFSHPDSFAAEEAVHFPLLEHPAPERILLIGGGASGSLREILKHPVKQVDYLELDPLIIEMVRRHFPAEVVSSLEDPRVKIHNIDGRLFLKESADTGGYDVIIVNLPDPYTAQLNRFYTREFFRMCKRKMASGAVLSLRVTSAENYISPELQQFLGCLYGTLQESFPDVKVIPGETNIFLASPARDVLTVDAGSLLERLAERDIKEKLLFVREYYLPFRLTEARVEQLAAVLSSAVSRKNTDLSPVCYYYDAVLWSKQFKGFSSSFLRAFSRVPPALVLGAIGILFASLAVIQWVSPARWGQGSILVAVGTTGFAEITVEVVTLLGFQVMHGYVYDRIAIIVTCFMIGLAGGAAATARIADSNVPKMRLFLVIQALVCLYPLLLMGALIWMNTVEPKAVSSDIIFPALAFAAGLVGGMQFPLANALWLAEIPGAARSAGYTYGIDLFGSCLGALLATALLIPIFGIPFACVTAAVLNLGSLLLLMLKFLPAKTQAGYSMIR